MITALSLSCEGVVICKEEHMAQVIKNMAQLVKALEPQITATLELVAEDTKQEIDKYLQKYYNEYNPSLGKSFRSHFYHRTYQLKNCCKIGKIHIDNSGVNIKVFLDIDSLHYNSKGAIAYKTIYAANAGLHGGYNINDMQRGQISWSKINNKHGKRFGSGTQIWEEPMQELIDNGKLIAIFKKCAKQRGLNIK